MYSYMQKIQQLYIISVNATRLCLPSLSWSDLTDYSACQPMEGLDMKGSEGLELSVLIYMIGEGWI